MHDDANANALEAKLTRRFQGGGSEPGYVRSKRLMPIADTGGKGRLDDRHHNQVTFALDAADHVRRDHRPGILLLRDAGLLRFAER